ncbi:hypothetical protein Gasu2_10860 [Galdieria sulphuraria]|uniref:Uncharacterized protein n=1 Tax=Galdieria sulphuraria TaxID=130081 RepID=M2Y7N0_GALSU|nr:uncharacterized protein Gasu_08220 [Galdieria sulphuraria]EME32078.1 hypothetical protein Gasu_08220 [Galdieria sulphuraria]GJD06684.1 hypothetical protein Gasu2_10860 [Galdieria sulphuraria]|eukprot:XP_005708598.1 hypothetical protein Gasu_08220 [Galdieria sulphuraria]
MRQSVAKGSHPMDIHSSHSLNKETDTKVIKSHKEEDEKQTTKSDSEDINSSIPVETVLKACSAPTCSESLLLGISPEGYMVKKARNNFRKIEKTSIQKDSWQQTLDADTPPYLSPQRKELKQSFDFY